jgi:hypothetical protein
MQRKILALPSTTGTETDQEPSYRLPAPLKKEENPTRGYDFS